MEPIGVGGNLTSNLRVRGKRFKRRRGSKREGLRDGVGNRGEREAEGGDGPSL